MRRFIPLQLLLLLLVGCPTMENPCDTDRFGCEESTVGFAIDPTCPLDGDLQVELGYGENGFTALPAGDMPPLHFGSQGGQHVYMALRVLNAALDRYKLLKVRFAFFLLKPCGDHPGGAPVDPEKSGPEDTCRYIQNVRNVLLGSQMPIRTLDDGTVEEFGMLVRVGDTPDEHRLIELRVDDPCGQTGIALNDIPAR